MTHDERYKVVVEGRNLLNIYNVLIQGRIEAIWAESRDFSDDGEPIITKIDVVPVRTEAG